VIAANTKLVHGRLPAFHYRELYITHRAFWYLERRAKYYDNYMKERKDWKKWPTSVDLEEIQRLLDFIPKWDRHFRGKNPVALFRIYSEILPVIDEMYNLSLQDINLTVDVMKQITEIFEKIARCSSRAYESTDCSKILHTMLPNLIVIWDRKIRQGLLGDENKRSGAVYSLEFLPQMQIELREAIATCMDSKGLKREEAIKYVRDLCGHESLPKLVDEHNYVSYTKSDDFKSYLGELREENKISKTEYHWLAKKIP